MNDRPTRSGIIDPTRTVVHPYLSESVCISTVR